MDASEIYHKITDLTVKRQILRDALKLLRVADPRYEDVAAEVTRFTKEIEALTVQRDALIEDSFESDRYESSRGALKAEDLDIKGLQFGARLRRRGLKNDPHVLIELYSEDDENWFSMGSFSTYWLPSLRALLHSIDEKLKADFEQEPDGYGYMFKENKNDGNLTD